jgi:hypothetical protein
MKRLMMLGAAILVTASVGVTLIGCPAAHDGFPGKDCKVQADCYMDEVCNMTTMKCEPPPVDMSVPLDFPMPDFHMDHDLTGADLTGSTDDLSEAPDMTEVDL